MLYILPSSIAAEGLHIVIPLFVIFLGGSVIDVGIVVALHYAASAIGSVFWGKFLDKFHEKRKILFICFSSITICSIGLFYTTTLDFVYVISPILGFFIIGKNPVTQLLVMESVSNNQWSRLFARTSIITTIGSFSAFLTGSLWNFYFDLSPYFLFCGIASGIATVLSVSVNKSGFLERETVAHSEHGVRYIFGHNRFHFHLVFPKFPKIYDFKHVISLFKGKISHEIGFLFLTNLLFYFGSNMYFTAFIPFLKKFDFQDSMVFSVYMVQTLVLLAVFFLVPRLTSIIGEEKAIRLSFIPRILGILVTAFIFPLTTGEISFVVIVIASGLMVAAFSVFSTANSIILFKAIPRGFEGTFLGVNSFMIGVGIFTGALTAGYVTSVFDYTVTFLISIGFLVVSLILFQLYNAKKLSHKTI